MTTDDQRISEPAPAASPPTEEELRQRAISRLKKRADFRTHVLVYVLVNTVLVVIWAVTGAPLFWPIFPILGWGIGLAANAWDVYRPDPVTEERIQQEMGRLRS
ncbi:2TM domain-containing protein [Actinomycetospora sp. C-140]